MHCDSGWTLLQCPDKFKKIHEDRTSEAFIFVEKPNVVIDSGWNKEKDGVMVQLDLPC